MRAFLHKPMRGFLANAAASTDDNDHLPREFFLGRHPLEFRFFKQPVFDVECLLLRQRDVFVNRLRPAHDFDRAIVKFRRDAGFRFIFAPRNHAAAGNQNDGRVGIAHRG